MLDTIAGSEARVIRTVLRSDVLKLLTGGPVDVMITASDAGFLIGEDFLVAFAARALPVSLLMLTRQVDEPTRERLDSVGVQVRHVAPPVSLSDLAEHVNDVLRGRKLGSTAQREPLPALVRRLRSECERFTLHVQVGGEYGSLGFLDGALVDAQSARHTGDRAALDILGWRHTNAFFDPTITPGPPTITRPLDELLLTAEAERSPDMPAIPSASEEILPPPSLVSTSSSTSARPSTADTPSIHPQTSSRRRKTEEDMANINKTLEEAMKIDGAIGAAIADWDSGMCLGTAGGGARLNIEVAAAGNCQVVKAKMSTMSELGIKGAIHDILITLDDQIHLIRPLRLGDNLFMYLAIDKTKGNLAMARHRLSKLDSELSM